MLEDLDDGQILVADRAYDSDALRNALSARGVWANVKPMPPRALSPTTRVASTNRKSRSTRGKRAWASDARPQGRYRMMGRWSGELGHRLGNRGRSYRLTQMRDVFDRANEHSLISVAAQAHRRAVGLGRLT